MTTQQLETLLSFYKKAVAKNLSPDDFIAQLNEANIKLDKSFVEDGKEDMNLGEFLQELKLLKTIIENEQS